MSICTRRGCERKALYAIHLVIPDKTGQHSPRFVGLPEFRVCQRHVDDVTAQAVLTPALRKVVEENAEGAEPDFDKAEVGKVSLTSRAFREAQKSRGRARGRQEAPRPTPTTQLAPPSARALAGMLAAVVGGVVAVRRPPDDDPEGTADPIGFEGRV